MTPEAPDSFPRVFAMGDGAVVLHESGLRHPRTPRLFGETFTDYADVTHHSVTSRGLRLATRSSVYTFPRSSFDDPRAPDELARELVERISALPAGDAQLDRMWAAEKRGARSREVRAAPILAVLCVACFVLDWILGGQRLFFAGLFSDVLVRAGEPWRIVTANLLHGGAAHLVLNGLGLVAIGSLVERVLGTPRTLVVLGAGALGGMGAGLLAHYEMAVGASGIVFGLVGALLWLEFFETRRLPAAWRIPRVVLIGAVVADGLLSLLVPAVAGLAHLGGLLAGAGACGLVARGALEQRRLAGFPVVLANVAILFLLGASLAAAGSVALAEGSPLARQARVLAAQEGLPPLTLNNLAWLIATDPRATPSDREIAVRLAERAVQGTRRRDPNILDTLAEAHFAAGSSDAAVHAIDEAIALAPGEAYFVEQRRRFTGDRAADDRPDPPQVWIGPRPEETPPEQEPPEREGKGLRI